MNWRIIIRLSLEGDQASKLRNQIAGLLNKCRIHNTGTGIWESAAGTPRDIALQLHEVLLTLAEITQDHPGDSSVNLDHIWIYIDKGPRREKNFFEIKV